LPHEYPLFTVPHYSPQHNGRTVENSLRRTICFSADKGGSRLDNSPNFVTERSLKTSSHHPLTRRTTIVSLDSSKIRWSHVTLLGTGNILVTYKVTVIKPMLVFQINFTYTNLQYKNSLRQGGSRSDILNNIYLEALAEITYSQILTAD